MQETDLCVYNLRREEMCRVNLKCKGPAREKDLISFNLNTSALNEYSSECFMEHTISEHAGGGKLDVGQGPEVVEHGTAVALLL